jgi:hypothetical protein
MNPNQRGHIASLSHQAQVGNLPQRKHPMFGIDVKAVKASLAQDDNCFLNCNYFFNLSFTKNGNY